MKVIEVKDYPEMSIVSGKYIIEKVKAQPSITLGLATGGTPEGTYQYLIKDHQENGTSYQNVTTFNLDEYIGLKTSHPNSYRHYMNTCFFNHININKFRTNIPKGYGSNPFDECLHYEQLIAAHGGIDLQILGIGSNGHIGFNEPGTKFDSKTHIVNLTDSTRKANARYFNNFEEVPMQAITMGIATIMKSKEILLLVSGESKKEAMKHLLCDEMSESFPASILQVHPHVTIIADQKSLAMAKLHC
jgi:glucosamine-6-phosphate deaminase